MEFTSIYFFIFFGNRFPGKNIGGSVLYCKENSSYKNKRQIMFLKNIIKKTVILRNPLDFIISDQMLAIGKEENLVRLYNEILNKDWFMSLLDFKDYIRVREMAYNDYEDRLNWADKMLVNISKAGYFSSDRTIAQYNQDIWKLNKNL